MGTQRLKQIFINARFLSQHVTGVQRYATELVKALDSLIGSGEIDTKKFSFVMLASRNSKHELNLKHIPLRKVGYLNGHSWEQLELPFYSHTGLLICPCNTAPVASLVSNQKTVVVVHDLSHLYFPEAYSFAFRILYKTVIPLVFIKADAVITVSESEKASILNYYDWSESKLYAIQNGALLNSYLHEKESISSGLSSTPGRFVLYVGSLSRRKNFQGVLQAIAYLSREDDVFLTVVGAEGKSFNCREFNIPSKIVNKVEFKGQVNNIYELIKLYKAASCLIFPSFHEASPLPPVEAMTCGCPVIASSIPALVERCGDAALYCNPYDSEDIAAKISLLINDPVLREELRYKGLERVKQFTWEKCARETFAIIEKVLAS